MARKNGRAYVTELQYYMLGVGHGYAEAQWDEFVFWMQHTFGHFEWGVDRDLTGYGDLEVIASGSSDDMTDVMFDLAKAIDKTLEGC